MKGKQGGAESSFWAKSDGLQSPCINHCPVPPQAFIRTQCTLKVIVSWGNTPASRGAPLLLLIKRPNGLLQLQTLNLFLRIFRPGSLSFVTVLPQIRGRWISHINFGFDI